MKKSAVYTRTGDTGLTGLVGGTRIKKSDARIHLYGEVDELNSAIGFSLALIKDDLKSGIHENEELNLINIQKKLFDIGSRLACESDKRDIFKLATIVESDVVKLETLIDEMDRELIPLKNFILPGGRPAAGAMHLARTICRRVERLMVAFNDQFPEEGEEVVYRYINRLSDFLFVFARLINHRCGQIEPIWFQETNLQA